jgi:hypothetical protein
MGALATDLDPLLDAADGEVVLLVDRHTGTVHMY